MEVRCWNLPKDGMQLSLGVSREVWTGEEDSSTKTITIHCFEIGLYKNTLSSRRETKPAVRTGSLINSTNMLSFLSAPLALLCISTLSLVAPLTALATNHKPPPKKTLTVENGLKYAYIYSPAKANQPTFLLLHGFPSSSSDWHNQVSDLTAAGYGVLAPDMLGYAGTSKPEEVEAYALSKMTSHVAKILDKEGLTEIIGVGHDWLVCIICA